MRATERYARVALALVAGAAVGITRPADAQDAPSASPPNGASMAGATTNGAPAEVPATPSSAASVAPATTTSAPPVAPAPSAPSYFLAPRPSPVDIAAFPPRPSARVEARPRGLELHGFVATWATPVTGNAPSASTDAFRLRFAVLRLDARPLDRVNVLVRVAPTVPGSMLLDAAVTYTPHDAIGVTAGQFRMPLGAAGTTLAPQLVMLDRPAYAYAMSMVAFRDVGVMIHSGPRGLANGVLHYRLAVASGTGRAGSGTTRPPGSAGDALYVARVMFEPSRFLFDDPASRLVVGGTYAHVHSDAIATGDAARDRSLAANVLGRTLVAYDQARSTQLGGADLTFEHRGVHSQAEVLYLHSVTDDATVTRKSLGASLELAYTLPVRIHDVVDLQVASRAERFDPRLGRAHDEETRASLGMNAIAGSVRGSVFGTLTFYDDATSGAARTAGELTFRASAAF